MSVDNIAIVPGNGGGDIMEGNWYQWTWRKLKEEFPEIKIAMKNMPDPVIAREKFWIPFMRSEEGLNIGDNSIIIGHSSGAVAAVRFCEKYRVRGVVLVSSCVTDLGCPDEKAAGYYDRPWMWDKVKENTDWVVQFGSTDDHFIPWHEQQEVADKLGTELHKYDDRGHFQGRTFPDLIKVIKQKISAVK